MSEHCAGPLMTVEEHGALCLDAFTTLLDAVEESQPISLYDTDKLVVHSLGVSMESCGARGYDPLSLPFSQAEFNELAAAPEWSHDADRRRYIASQLQDWLSFGTVITADGVEAKPVNYLGRLRPNLGLWEQRLAVDALSHRITPEFTFGYFERNYSEDPRPLDSLLAAITEEFI